MNAMEKLDVFKRGHLLTVTIYKITNTFPKTECYNLVSQMQRAAVSINSNLAEGGARNTDGEKKHFVGIARGSVAELSYQLLLAKDLGYISEEEFNKYNKEINEIRMMLTGLLKKIDSNL